jgi:hypothetical protein
VVKVLALAPGRRLHREQVIDLIWPGDTIAEAVPKLHKAAHFARRAASSSARATWTCCAWTASGRRWPSSTRATSAPTSP